MFGAIWWCNFFRSYQISRSICTEMGQYVAGRAAGSEFVCQKKPIRIVLEVIEIKELMADLGLFLVRIVIFVKTKW